MKVKVDKEKCIGCGVCESLCPSVFVMKDGKAIVKKASGDKCTQEAADSCPTQAIEIK